MAKISTLIENFNDNLFPASFTDTAGAASTVSGGQLAIAKGGGAAYQVVDSVAAYDLDESAIYDQVVDAGDQSNASNEMYPMRLYNSTDNTDGFEWGIFNGVLKAFYRVDGVMTVVKGDVSYNAAVHKWFQIREASGVTYWEFKTNAADSWTEYTHVSTPAGITHTSLKVQLSVGSWDTAPDTTAIWDNINYTPSAGGNTGSVGKVPTANVGTVLRTLKANVARFLGVNI